MFLHEKENNNQDQFFFRKQKASISIHIKSHKNKQKTNQSKETIYNRVSSGSKIMNDTPSATTFEALNETTRQQQQRQRQRQRRGIDNDDTETPEEAMRRGDCRIGRNNVAPLPTNIGRNDRQQQIGTTTTNAVQQQRRQGHHDDEVSTARKKQNQQSITTSNHTRNTNRHDNDGTLAAFTARHLQKEIDHFDSKKTQEKKKKNQNGYTNHHDHDEALSVFTARHLQKEIDHFDSKIQEKKTKNQHDDGISMLTAVNHLHEDNVDYSKMRSKETRQSRLVELNDNTTTTNQDESIGDVIQMPQMDQETNLEQRNAATTSRISRNQHNPYRHRRGESTTSQSSSSVPHWDDESEIRPGFVHVPGIGGHTLLNDHGDHYENNHYNDVNSSREEASNGIVAARPVPADEELISVGERERIRREAQENIINKAVRAEVSQDTQSYSKWYYFLCIATVILGTVVVASVLATQTPDRGPINDNGNEQSDVILDNSFCNQSFTIELDGIPFIGSIDTTIPQQQVDHTLCGLFVYDHTSKTNITDAEADEVEVFTRGRWFSFVGTGSTVTASTCYNTNFNTRIFVFSGSTCNNKNDLICIHGNDNNPTTCCAPNDDNPFDTDANCNERSSVTWVAENGLQYFIFVHGATVDDVGDFELTLSSSRSDSNNFCDTAIRIASMNGVPIIGSNELATVDQIETCGSVQQNGPGVWYVLEGDGSLLAASTCGEDTSTSIATLATSSFLVDTQISVLQGKCDGSNGQGGTFESGLECIAGNDNNVCGSSSSQSRVVWESIANEIYYVYVHSNDGGRGTFEISVTKTDRVSECLDENVNLYETPGIGNVIDELNESLNDNVLTDCTGFICTYDLHDYPISIMKPCETNGGRYVEYTMVELLCDNSLIIQLLNYPYCVSFLCEDERIKRVFEFQFDAAASILFAPALTCGLNKLDL